MAVDSGAGHPEQYRPRHALTEEERRARRLARTDQPEPSAADDVRAPGIAALFRRHPERTRRAAGAAGAVALTVLLASSVANASTGSRAGARRPVADTAALAKLAVPSTATPRSSATRAGSATLISAAPTKLVASNQQAPATKAVISGLAGNGIPNVALNAYRVAADRMAHVQPSCGIDWALLAGIGREESDHGRFGGARLNPDGTSTPRIIGPALNGDGNQYIPAPPNGFALDGDAKYTHALGPMQFIPQTWAAYGADANGDGKADIFNINDAALGAARYLCANGGNLRTAAGQERAILAYNHSDQYLAQVLALADAYRAGVPVTGIPVGNITGALPPITAPAPLPVNPGPPTAASSSSLSRAGGSAPSRSGTKPGGTGGGTSGAGRGTTSGAPSGSGGSGGTKKGTGSGSGSGGGTSGSGSGSGGSGGSGGPAGTPTPTPTPTPGGGGSLPLPVKLPTKLPTKPPVPSPPSSTAAAPKPSPTCVVGIGGTCVIH